MEDKAKEVGAAIKHYRELRSYSGSALCRELGINRSTLFLWETGKQLPSPDNLRRLANILKVSIDDLKK